MLKKDKRTLQFLNPDPPMLRSFNLGTLIESYDPDERELGLSLAIYLLREDPKALMRDICLDEQSLARDLIQKRQN